MTYDEAMVALNEAVYRAARLADSHDGAPAHALRDLAAEVDCLIDHNCTREEFADAERLYRGAVSAGMAGSY